MAVCRYQDAQSVYICSPAHCKAKNTLMTDLSARTPSMFGIFVFSFSFLFGGSENSTQIVLPNIYPKPMMHTFSNTRRNSSCRNPMRESSYHHNLNTPDDPSQFAYFSKILHHFEIKRGIELPIYSMGLLVRCRPPMISHW